MMANQIISNVAGDAQTGQSQSAAEYSYNPKQQTLNLESGMMMGDPAGSDDDTPTPDRSTAVAEARADVAASDASDAATTTTVAASSDAPTDSWAAPAAQADATPATQADAAPASTTTATAGSDDIIGQFASGWEKTSADITSTTSTADPFKNNWDGTPISATSTTTAAADDKFTFSWERSSAPSTTTSNPANSLSNWESEFGSKPATQASQESAPEDYVKKYGLGTESAPAATESSQPSKDGVLTEMNKLLGKTTSPDGMWIQQHAVGHKGRTHRLVSIRLHKSK